jgi:ankyrin repeat protein
MMLRIVLVLLSALIASGSGLMPRAAAAADLTEQQQMLLNYVAANQSEQLERALAGGADPNFVDPRGPTPLGFAAGKGQRELVEMLLRYKADANLADPEGMTPLMYARAHPEVLKLLVDAGAKLDLRDQSGMTALLWAVVGENADAAVAVLLKAGANPSDRQGEGIPAISIAAKEGKVGTIRELATAGADLKATLPGPKMPNLTPLMVVIATGKRNQPECLQVLIDAGSDVNFRAQGGITPLMMAVSTGRPELVTPLLKAGADRAAKADNGMTAMDVAQRVGNPAIVALLSPG